MIETQKQLKSFLKSKRRGKYTHSSGIFYPGIKCGHKLCKIGSHGVPSYMGWNWNTDITGICRVSCLKINFFPSYNLKICIKMFTQIKKGWRPGAIPKKIKEIMCHFLSPCPCDTLPVTKKLLKNKTNEEKMDEPCDIQQKPTLSVQKKDGDYLITMRPLKNTADLRNEPNPYLTAKPIKFKISRRAEEKKCDEIRALVNKKGFRKCTCGNIVACCNCRDNKEMDALRKCLKECEDNYKIKSLEYKLCLKESLSDPKLNVEFTPPAGIVNKNIKKLPNLVYQETQYNEDDFKIVPLDADNGGNRKSGGKNISFDKTGKAGSNKSGIFGSNRNGKNPGVSGMDKSGKDVGKSGGNKNTGKSGLMAGGAGATNKTNGSNKNGGTSNGGAGATNKTIGSNKNGGPSKTTTNAGSARPKSVKL